jgi:hypothetical protein
MKRPGYYVEGRYYRDNFHQAKARAEWLAEEYGRPVEVLRLDPNAVGAVCVLTVVRRKAAA